VETCWRRKSGESFSVLLSSAPLDPAHPEEGTTFTVLDLSSRQRALDQARVSEARYQRLFDTMTEGVVYQNAAGEILSANPAAQRLLGLTLDQLTGRTSIDPRWQAVRDDRTPFPGEEHPSMTALRTGRPVAGVIMGVFNPVLGERRWLRINATPLFDGGATQPFQVYTMFSEISEPPARSVTSPAPEEPA
jgi:two-component system CheB/CheR fusion protein